MTISLVATEPKPKGVRVDIVDNARMVRGTTLLKRGKYTVYLRLRNLSGDQVVEKLLPLKM